MLSWYSRCDADLSGIEQRITERKYLAGFQSVLSQCFGSYRRREYAITIPSVTAALESLIRAFAPAEHRWTTKIERVVSKQYGNAQNIENGLVIASVWMSVLTFVQWFYAQYGATSAGDSRVFRHGIQHGTQPPPNDQIESLRLFHALDTVSFLFSAHNE
jgi:hypothetical protein